MSASRASSNSLHAHLEHFARSSKAVFLVFAWGFAEALWWPIIPDFVVAPLALVAPRRFAVLALAATAGSVGGGAAAYLLGNGSSIAEGLPLVTARMTSQAAALMESGPAALLHQPLSGIPYKVFAYGAQAAGLALPSFLAWTAAARGARLLAVGLGFAIGGAALGKVWPRFIVPFLVAYSTLFALGLRATYQMWR